MIDVDAWGVHGALRPWRCASHPRRVLFAVQLELEALLGAAAGGADSAHSAAGRDVFGPGRRDEPTDDDARHCRAWVARVIQALTTEIATALEHEDGLA